MTSTLTEVRIDKAKKLQMANLTYWLYFIIQISAVIITSEMLPKPFSHIVYKSDQDVKPSL